LVVNKLEKRHVGRPRKVVITILPPQEIKREDENLLRMGATKEERIVTYKG
jgi:hypothetical protein